MLKGVLLDLGGVVYVGDALLPGACGAIARLKGSGLAVRFLTNITRQSRQGLRSQLAGMDLKVADQELFMPATTARKYLLEHRLKPLLLVHPTLQAEFEGLPDAGPQAVVIGDAGEGFAYASLNKAYRALSRGAPLIALANNRVFRDSDGELSLDAGAFVAALEYASGKKARVFGKPSGEFFAAAVKSMNCTTSETIMVGDDVEFDVAGALSAGLGGILVRTGKYQLGAEASIDPPPTAVVDDLAEAAEWILTHRNNLDVR